MKRTMALVRSPSCEVAGCESTIRLQVHHRRYPKVYGKEPISWLVVLCSKHHRALHQTSRKRGIGLEKATRITIGEIKEEHVEIRDGKEFKVTVLADGEKSLKQKPFGKNHNARKHNKRRQIGKRRRRKR